MPLVHHALVHPRSCSTSDRARSGGDPAGRPAPICTIPTGCGQGPLVPRFVVQPPRPLPGEASVPRRETLPPFMEARRRPRSRLRPVARPSPAPRRSTNILIPSMRDGSLDLLLFSLIRPCTSVTGRTPPFLGPGRDEGSTDRSLAVSIGLARQDPGHLVAFGPGERPTVGVEDARAFPGPTDVRSRVPVPSQCPHGRPRSIGREGGQ
jgi:hypothetical protein